MVVRRRGGSRRLPSLGQDFDRGHREYVDRMTDAGRLWLWTKPFSAPPNYELAECLHTFAHVVRHLGLGLRAQVLDVGCGPGWMSELLARCGYWVTGVDISDDMVEIARGRIERIPGEVGVGIEPLAEFHAMPVRELPWSERFDAAILYDTMHHFDDELKTLEVIFRTLVPGGWIYIREGSKPPSGSESERNLIEEMRQYETLESPFDPDYLVEVLESAGFVGVTRFLVVDELVDTADAREPLRHLRRFWRYRHAKGEMNTVVARKPYGAELPSDGANFAGRIERAGPWRDAHEATERLLPIRVTNTGSAYWPSSAHYPFPQGVVTVGPYTLDGDARIELARASLPHGVSPGASADVVVRVPRDLGAGELRLDLVREGLAWFSELGSEPLVVSLED
jgi:SAM-dependent methyltransferase